MSKMRIYELARELGVDNKVVIDKATELGMSGKASHSNSLDSDEADHIRRAIIRQAIGVAPERETVTTRVDKVSGATEAIVEKRKGNVIRRRKAASDEGGTEGGVAEAAEPIAAAPIEPEESRPQGKFAEADALFKGGASQATNVDEPEEIAEPVETESVAEISAPEVVEPEPVGGAAPAAAAAPEELKKGPGPRVLGKIELPQKRVEIGRAHV